MQDVKLGNKGIEGARLMRRVAGIVELWRELEERHIIELRYSTSSLAFVRAIVRQGK